VVFAGAILLWMFNSLANAIRSTGNMAVPAIITCAGAAALIPLSPCLIFGWVSSGRLGGGSMKEATDALGTTLRMSVWTAYPHPLPSVPFISHPAEVARLIEQAAMAAEK
jgi:Na+-driven multidrug efflux pump